MMPRTFFHPLKGGEAPIGWRDLDAFTQGYIEALFFTENAPGVTTEEWQATEDHAEGSIPEDVAFSDLAPEALEAILRDCASFYAANEATIDDALAANECADVCEGTTQAGRDFWYTRNGHGCGFWDGDWPEPYATTLDDAAKAFREASVYLGDDGRVYLEGGV